MKISEKFQAVKRRTCGVSLANFRVTRFRPGAGPRSLQDTYHPKSCNPNAYPGAEVNVWAKLMPQSADGLNVALLGPA